MRLIRSAALVAVCGSVALIATPAQAFFHLWRFSEVFSNDDGTVQFIEMTTTAPSETFATGFSTMTIQSTSTGKTFTFNHNLSGSTTNKRILIATSGFETQPGLPTTPSLLTSDYTLAANFMNPAGDTIRFCQNGCSGFGILESRTFAALPTDGTMSLVYPAGTAGLNSPTNFAGTTGSVNLAPPMNSGDYNGDQTVDAADYTVWRDAFGAEVDPGSGADGNGDGTINDGDYEHWKLNFGTVLPGAGSVAGIVVPEPTVASLFCGGLWAALLSSLRARRRANSP
ncbi:MAG: dockerin type I domain-containing protein [Pirellulales bacterium]